MTCTDTTSPTRPAASAPASTAARTAATSPRRVIATRPLPTLCCSTNCTFAAFSAASHASTAATIPLVSIRPIASPLAMSFSDSVSVEPRSHEAHERGRKINLVSAVRVLRGFVVQFLIRSEHGLRLSCDDQFLVCWDDPDFRVGLDTADLLFPAADQVLLRVEHDAGPLQVAADGGTEV